MKSQNLIFAHQYAETGNINIAKIPFKNSPLEKGLQAFIDRLQIYDYIS